MEPSGGALAITSRCNLEASHEAHVRTYRPRRSVVSDAEAENNDPRGTEGGQGGVLVDVQGLAERARSIRQTQVQPTKVTFMESFSL